MRRHGVDFPEPGAKRSSKHKSLDTTTPTYKAAIASCRSILITALRPKPAGRPPAAAGK
jgi:hypothetical protein